MVSSSTSSAEPRRNPGVDSTCGSAEEVELDTMQLCNSLIDNLYERTSTEQPTGSFVDAYDILSAAIILTCLHRRLGRQEPQHFASLMTSINKAMTIVTQIAGRFVALKAFQDTLLKLSGHVMALQYSTNDVSLKRSSYGGCLILIENRPCLNLC